MLLISNAQYVRSPADGVPEYIVTELPSGFSRCPNRHLRGREMATLHPEALAFPLVAAVVVWRVHSAPGPAFWITLLHNYNQRIRDRWAFWLWYKVWRYFYVPWYSAFLEQIPKWRLANRELHLIEWKPGIELWNSPDDESAKIWFLSDGAGPKSASGASQMGASRRQQPRFLSFSYNRTEMVRYNMNFFFWYAHWNGSRRVSSLSEWMIRRC